MSVDPSRVSVVMSVRDGERHLEAAITSVLRQSVRPGEVVVVDDGSHDGTADVLASFGSSVRVLHQRPTGTAAGLNRGVAAAGGDVLAFLDGDDLWTPDSIATRLDRLSGADAPMGVYGRTVQFVSAEVSAEDAARLRFDPRPAAAPLSGALLVRREVFASIGGFDERLPSAEGVDWIARVRAAMLPIVAIDEVVLHRRLHDGNLGRTLPRETTLAALRAVARAQHKRRKESR